MKTVADLHNCVFDNPEFFNGMKDLTIITGKSAKERVEVVLGLKIAGVRYKELIMCPFEVKEREDYYRSKVWKIDTVVKLRPDIFIEDNLRVLLSVQKASPETTCMLLINDTYRPIDLGKKYGDKSKELTRKWFRKLRGGGEEWNLE